MSSLAHRIARRARTVLRFARTGQSAADWPALALAGFSRQRPFGDDSWYSRVGRMFGREITPHVRDAGGLRIPLDLLDSAETTVFDEIFVEHVYPLESVPFVPDLVIDCGAYCGMFSLLAHATFPFARKVAFEPGRANARRFRHAITVNEAPIELHEAAVGPADGTGHFSGSGYGGKVGESQTDGYDVRIVSLPRLLRELRPRRLVLKIDIEGAERELLPAIVDQLPTETVIFLETHDDEAVVAGYLAPLLRTGFTDRLIRSRHEGQLYTERVLIRTQPPLRHFCTYFDRNYASLGLALYASLTRHCTHFKLWVLCLDAECEAVLRALGHENIIPISLAELEAADPELARTKSTRNRIEYIFTCTPCLPLHVMRRDPSVELVTYLDADLWFVQTPEPIFDEIGPRSVAIVPHRFSPGLERLAENGRFNVGWISFRRSESGLACLNHWREQCIEWCYVRHEPGRYADQKYLDTWPERFAEVCEIQHTGANLGLWNLRGSRLSQQREHITVDGSPLVFFHFHGLRRPRLWLFCLNSPFYGVRLSPALNRRVLQPYAEEVCRLEDQLGLEPANGTRLETDESGGWLARIRFVPHAIMHIVAGNYVVAKHRSSPWWL